MREVCKDLSFGIDSGDAFIYLEVEGFLLIVDLALIHGLTYSCRAICEKADDALSINFLYGFIIIDTSHISDEGFWDIMDITEAPVIATHSNSRTVHNCSRNLTDDMFRAVRDSGGVVGIKVVDGSEDLLLVTQSGILIRTAVENIRETGRATQGVIVMRFKEEGDQVISLALTEKEEETAE